MGRVRSTSPLLMKAALVTMANQRDAPSDSKTTMPNPIDSYRVGGNGMVHFYSGNRPILSAHASSPAVGAKIRALDAAKGATPELDDAYRRAEADTGPRHGSPSTRDELDLAALDSSAARAEP